MQSCYYEPALDIMRDGYFGYMNCAVKQQLNSRSETSKVSLKLTKLKMTIQFKSEFLNRLHSDTPFLESRLYYIWF